MKLLLPLILLSALSAHAGTYYADYSTGSDANPGTKVSPWKYAPGMVGSSHTLSAGDSIILKGGITWPRSCFQLHITTGGSSGSPITYGSDQTWYSGTSWTRPLFDFQHVGIGTGYYTSAGIFVDGISSAIGYITFDGIEIANLRCFPGSAGQQGFSILYYGNVTFCTVTNCVIRDWDLPTPVHADDDHTNSGGIGWPLTSAGGGWGNVVTHCTMFQSGSVKSGTALRNLSTIAYTEVYGCPEAFLGAATIHDCSFHDLPAPSDPNQHGNCIEGFGVCTIYNNFLYNLDDSVAPILIASDWGQPGGVSSVYNNVMWNTGHQRPIGMDSGGNAPATVGMRVYNNTIVHEGGTLVDAVYRAASYPAYKLFDVRNNHFITSYASPVGYNNPPTSANVTTPTVSNNTTQTLAAATAQGYLAANLYATPAGGVSIHAGTDLSAQGFNTDILNNLRGETWDTGGYQYTGSAPPANGTLSFSPASYTVNETNANVSVTVIRTSGSSGTIGFSYATSDGTATAGHDYTSTSGTASMAAGVTSYTITIPILLSGDTGTTRTFSISINSPTGGATLGTPSYATITITLLPSPPTIPLSVYPTILATNGLLSSMTVSNDVIYQLTPSFLGTATYQMVLTNSGQFTMTSDVYAPDGGDNSAWVNWNTNTLGNDSFCWDVVNFTSGFETRPISWRGTGAYNAPQFGTNIWTLSAGTNTFYFGAREPGGWRSFTLVPYNIPVPPPPGYLQFDQPGLYAYTIAQPISVNLVRYVGTNQVTTVDYETVQGTALAGRNFASTNGTISFAAGDISKPITVNLLTDSVYRGTLYFQIKLSNVSTNSAIQQPNPLLVTLSPSAAAMVNALMYSGKVYSGTIR